VKRIRLMLLPRYDRQGASSRLRSYQFIPFLTEVGIDVEIFPFFHSGYLAALYRKGHRSFGNVLTSYIARLRTLVRGREYDAVWLEKEVFPWIPFLFERGFLRRHRIIVDYDDAIFHNYDENKSAIIRRVLGTKIDHVMQSASLVTVGNSYLAARAERAGARRIEYLPTVVDTARYSAVGACKARCNIGWIGTPKTAAYLHLVQPALRNINKAYGARAVLIGSGAIKLGVPAEIHSWFEDTEAQKLTAIDIGIMPLPDEPWERGKCGYKLIQYMAAGIPVVASPVGVNVDIIRDGVNGFLASSVAEWETALTKLACDADLRTTMGMAGRAMIEQRFSTRVVAPKLAKLIREVAG
jgi:glycosyltransferase involved in cell wall biosynthesis